MAEGDIKLSELSTAESLTNAALLYIAIVDAQSDTGFGERKVTTEALGVLLNNSIVYASYLTTSNKSVIGAINELAKDKNIAAEYDSTATYAVGAYCIHEGTLYKCTTAISTAEDWTAAHWTSVLVMNEIGSGGGGGSTVSWSQIVTTGTKIATVMINGVTTDVYAPTSGGSAYTDVTGTLSAGSTSLTLQDASITTSSTLDFYTDTFGVNPTNAVVTTGQVVLTFEAQQAAVNVKVRIW